MNDVDWPTASDGSRVAWIAGEDRNHVCIARLHDGPKVGVGHGHTRRRTYLGREVSLARAKDFVYHPQPVDRRPRSPSPVPAGFDPYCRGHDQRNVEGPPFPVCYDLDQADQPSVFWVGSVTESLDGFVVEDN